MTNTNEFIKKLKKQSVFCFIVMFIGFNLTEEDLKVSPTQADIVGHEAFELGEI